MLRGKSTCSYYDRKGKNFECRFDQDILNGVPTMNIRNRMIAAADRKGELLTYSTELNRLINIVERVIQYTRPTAKELLELYKD